MNDTIKKTPDQLVLRVATLAEVMKARIGEQAFAEHRDALKHVVEDLEDILVEVLETEADLAAAIKAQEEPGHGTLENLKEHIEDPKNSPIVVVPDPKGRVR